jgi:hypothetical protein
MRIDYIVPARPPRVRYLASTHTVPVGAFFLRRAVNRTLSSPWSGWTFPFQQNGRQGRGEDLSPSPPVRHPTTAAQGSGAMGDKAKPLGVGESAGGFAVFGDGPRGVIARTKMSRAAPGQQRKTQRRSGLKWPLGAQRLDVTLRNDGSVLRPAAPSRRSVGK